MRALIDLLTFRWLVRLFERPKDRTPPGPEPAAPPSVEAPPARRPDTTAGSIAMSSVAVEEPSGPRAAPGRGRPVAELAAGDLDDCMTAALAALDASIERARTRGSLGPHLHQRAAGAIERWNELSADLESRLGGARLERHRRWFAELEACFQEIREREDELSRRHEVGMTEMSRSTQAMGSVYRTKLSELLREGHAIQSER